LVFLIAFSFLTLSSPQPTCFPGAYYRKALSTQSTWLGIKGTVVLPTLWFDPNRVNPAKPEQYLDNPSVYMGGTSNAQETDIGMTWEVIKYDNGTISPAHLAFRPFLRRSAFPPTGQDSLYVNAPAVSQFYWYPGNVITMSVFVNQDRNLHFVVDGMGKHWETDFAVDGYNLTSLIMFKRVNSIDQVNNEGKPCQPTKTTISNSTWQSCALFDRNMVATPMSRTRYADMRCPDAKFFNITLTPDQDKLGGEAISISGAGY